MSTTRTALSYRVQSRSETEQQSRFPLSQARPLVWYARADGAQFARVVRSCRGGRVARGRDPGRDWSRRADRLGGGLGGARNSRRCVRRRAGGRLHRVPALPERLLTRVGILGAPRPVPRRWVPALGGALTIAIALPLYVIAGWPLAGWAIAAVLWAGVQAFGLLLARLKPGPDNLAGSGAFAFGMMLRLLAVLVVLLAVVSSDKDAGLAAALTYGVAYSAELVLNLVGYYGQEPSL